MEQVYNGSSRYACVDGDGTIYPEQRSVSLAKSHIFHTMQDMVDEELYSMVIHYSIYEIDSEFVPYSHISDNPELTVIEPMLTDHCIVHPHVPGCVFGNHVWVEEYKFPHGDGVIIHDKCRCGFNRITNTHVTCDVCYMSGFDCVQYLKPKGDLKP